MKCVWISVNSSSRDEIFFLLWSIIAWTNCFTYCRSCTCQTTFNSLQRTHLFLQDTQKKNNKINLRRTAAVLGAIKVMVSPPTTVVVEVEGTPCVETFPRNEDASGVWCLVCEWLGVEEEDGWKRRSGFWFMGDRKDMERRRRKRRTGNTIYGVELSVAIYISIFSLFCHSSLKGWRRWRHVQTWSKTKFMNGFSFVRSVTHPVTYSFGRSNLMSGIIPPYVSITLRSVTVPFLVLWLTHIPLTWLWRRN